LFRHLARLFKKQHNPKEKKRKKKAFGITLHLGQAQGQLIHFKRKKTNWLLVYPCACDIG
jgi:hypothetical protein